MIVGGRGMGCGRGVSEIGGDTGTGVVVCVGLGVDFGRVGRTGATWMISGGSGLCDEPVLSGTLMLVS